MIPNNTRTSLHLILMVVIQYRSAATAAECKDRVRETLWVSPLSWRQKTHCHNYYITMCGCLMKSKLPVPSDKEATTWRRMDSNSTRKGRALGHWLYSVHTWSTQEVLFSENRNRNATEHDHQRHSGMRFPHLTRINTTRTTTSLSTTALHWTVHCKHNTRPLVLRLGQSLESS